MAAADSPRSPRSLGLGGLGLATSPWASWQCLAVKAEGHHGGIADDELGGDGPWVVALVVFGGGGCRGWGVWRGGRSWWYSAHRGALPPILESV